MAECEPRDWLDARAARRAFERAAALGAESFVAREIERRMGERLDYILHAPSRIVEAGCGAGHGVALLRRRYPRAEIVALDHAAGMLRLARGTRPLADRLRTFAGGGRTRFVQADLGAAALRPGCCDMLWSNLALAWSPDPPAAIRGWGGALASGALAMFTTFGPDTLRELAAAFRAADAGPHVHPFVDMHDIGDMLVAAGFGEPVIDMEVLTLTYESPERLLAELRAAGYGNAHTARRRSLMGATAWRRMIDAYMTSAAAGRVPATFEIVYGHAWKAAPRVAADGRAIVHFDGLGMTRKSA